MADYPYTPNATSIKRFLEHIPKAGVPEKVTLRYLVQVGFKSTNDRYLIPILKFIGFLTSNGAPTPLWQSYRNRTQGAKVLAGALQKSYADLFNTYPDAHRKDSEALRNYFSAHSTVAESTLGLIVATFKTLCAAADFDNPIQALEVESSSILTPIAEPATASVPAPSTASTSRIPLPAININIQLQLPATDDVKIYDNLAMKKYLYP